MALNSYDEDPFNREDFQEDTLPEPEKKPANRTFLLVIIILGVIFLLALLSLLVFAPKLIAKQRSAQIEQAALINAANTATMMAAIVQQDMVNTQQALTAIALMPTDLPTNTATVAVPTKTATTIAGTQNPVVAGTALSVEELATVAALQTQMAAQGTGLPAGQIPTPVPAGQNPTSVPAGQNPTSVPAGQNPTPAAGGQNPTTVPTQTKTGTQAIAFATPTALPETGFMDNTGLPMMAILAFLLITIIIFSRHLRLTTK